MKTHKFVHFIVLISLSVVFLSGCLPAPKSVTHTPQPTPTEYPFDSGPEFDCWRVQSNPVSMVSAEDLLFIVAFPLVSPLPPGQKKLLSFDPQNRTYQIVFPNIFFQLSYPGNLISPSRNAISYMNLDEFEYLQLNIYDVWRNVLIQVPNPGGIPRTDAWNNTHWSPDGQCLFSDYAGSHFAYRLSDGALQQKYLPEIDTWPGYIPSPNGHWKVFWRITEILVTDSEGNTLSSSAFTAPCDIVELHWSPNSQYLAFAYSSTCQNTQIDPYSVRLVEFHQDGSISYKNILDIHRYPSQIVWANDSSALFIQDGISYLWKFDIEKQYVTNLINLMPEDYAVHNFCVSANGKTIYSINNDTPNGEAELYSFDLITGENIAYPLPEEYHTFEIGPENSEPVRHSFIGLYCAVKSMP